MALFHSFLWLKSIPFHSIHTAYSLSIHLSMDRCFHCEQCCCEPICVHVFFQIIVLSRYMPRSGIAGSYGSSNFSSCEEGIHRPGPHLRPVHADHARPPLQWTLHSVFSVYGNDDRRIRPPRTGESWRSYPGYSLAKRTHTLITPSSR